MVRLDSEKRPVVVIYIGHVYTGLVPTPKSIAVNTGGYT